ncbi:MAG: hypothetical protein WBD55_00930, partial [Dehalococcoidia bacterium]
DTPLPSDTGTPPPTETLVPETETPTPTFISQVLGPGTPVIQLPSTGGSDAPGGGDGSIWPAAIAGLAATIVAAGTTMGVMRARRRS